MYVHISAIYNGFLLYNASVHLIISEPMSYSLMSMNTVANNHQTRDPTIAATAVLHLMIRDCDVSREEKKCFFKKRNTLKFVLIWECNAGKVHC